MNSADTLTSQQAIKEEAKLAALVDWATQHGVGQTLAILLHACDANELFHVNAVVQFLVLPSVAVVMREWLSWDSDWADLVSLSDQLLAAPHILKLFPPLPRGRELAKQWKNRVRTSHIPLCLAAPHPPREFGLSVFFEQLRVWLVIQGFRRSRRAQRRREGHDLRIERVANWLRLGADRQQSRRVLGWIEALRCAPEDDGALSRLLISRIDEIDTDGEQDEFLKAVRKISEAEESPSTQRGAEGLSVSLAQLHALADASTENVSENLVHEAPDADELMGALPDHGSETTCGTRLLSGRGLRILSAEALQFLPWSWHVPSPIEQPKLWAMIDSWKTSGDSTLCLLAFLSHVAILTSRSLVQAQSLRISIDPQEDWTVTPDGNALHRLPPRRSERVHAQPSWLPMLRPLLPSLRFEISELRSSVHTWRRDLVSLKELWESVSPDQSASSLFDRECARSSDLARLTSGCLEYVFAAKVYDASGDGVLAQLLSSGHRTAFGGNCAYPSWTTDALRTACQQVPCRFEIVGDDHANAAGSELDPLDSELRDAILLAEKRIGQLAAEPQHWIQHHNAVVTYVLAALFAATGARPVTDPFESAADFDWDRKWVFVADKIAPGHGGRLIPLPDNAFKLLLDYRAHLGTLAGQLPPQAAQLAAEIRALAGGTENCRLPFFFFLREDTLGWYTVSEATLKGQGFFACHLPWNIMRHRLATRLREARVDQEVIDALLGHADRGVLTYGEYSARCWQADMDAVFPALAATYEALQFCTEVPHARDTRFDLRLLGDPEQLIREQVFGNKRRETNRSRELRKQWQIVTAEYRKALNGRNPEALESEEWAALAKTIRTRDGIHAHPLGVWRYNILRSYLGHVASIRPLRLGPAFAAEHEARPRLRQKVIGCTEKLRALRIWFAEAPCHPQKSKLRTCQHLALAALDIALYSRISSWPLLRDVLSKKNCRIVINDGRAFLEHNRTLDSAEDAPVQRYRVSLRCAEWLDAAFGEQDADAHGYVMRSRWRRSWPIPDLGPPPANTTELIKFVADIVDQANFVELPGLIAGYRAGRVSSNALRHGTWMLEEHGVLIRGNPHGHQPGKVGAPPALPSKISLWKAPTPTALTAEGASRMIDNIRTTVEAFEKARRLPERSMSRQEVTDGICRAVLAETGAVSSALWCFGTWLHDLATRDGRRGKALAPSTIARYLNSLATRFLQVGVDFNLLHADATEIADFYERLLNHHRDIDVRYVANRLRDFHVFLTTFYGTCAIDWGSIDCGQVVAHASPGSVGFQQYQNALRLLAPDPTKISGYRLAAAFLLLLSFRFGVRCADGAWLRSSDFHEFACEGTHDAHRVVTVQSYWRRDTKAQMTRRLVPQAEPWTPFETEIASNFCAPLAEHRRRDPSFALFAEDPKGNVYDIDKLASLINDALSAAHGGDRVTEHKARHAFADRIGCALLSSHVRPRLVENRDAAADRERMCNLLLGTARPTRRAAWAFSRTLGHAGPPITFAAYFHRLGTWSDEWNGASLDRLDRACGLVKVPRAFSLDRLHRQIWAPAAPVPFNEAGPASLKDIVKYLGLLRAGCSTRVAAQHSGISNSTSLRLDQILEVVTHRLAARGRRADRQDLRCLARDLAETEWVVMGNKCDTADPESNSCFDGPRSLKEAAEVVSGDRQLLMWRATHCTWMAAFTATFKLASEDLTLIWTKRAGPEIEGWMQTTGLTSLFTPIPQPAMRVGAPPAQILDGLRARVSDRAALMVRHKPGGTRIRSQGLVLLWVIFAAYIAERQPWAQ